MRPRRFQARPELQVPRTALNTSGDSAPTSISIQPVFYRSSLDFISTEPWVGIPTPILAVLLVEGVDLPFWSRSTNDGYWPAGNRERARVKGTIQPEQPGVSLALLSPPDPSVLTLVHAVYDGPSAADRYRRRKERQKITTTWATEYNASRFSFLPATAFGDNICRIMREIKRHFLENNIADLDVWSLWTRAEVEASYNYRISKFLLETEFIRERRQVVVNAGTAEYSLPSDTISVCRAAFNDDVLTRVDEWQMDTGQVGWEASAGTPYAYIEDSSTGTLRVTLVPTPSANGVLNLIIVPAMTDNGERCRSTVIPAVFSPYVKWGVIADLLGKEGEANDPERATYAEGRFNEGVELGKLYVAARGR